MQLWPALRAICPPKLGGYYRFNSSSLDRSPIRGLDLLSSLANDLAAITEAVPGLFGALQGARTPAEQEAAGRRIAAALGQLDDLTYRLYEVGDTDIELIEYAVPDLYPR